jgi:hypothetical protein
MTALDVGLYVPQMGFTFADMQHRALRTARHRFVVALRPPVRPRRAEPPVTRGVDARDGVAFANRTVDQASLPEVAQVAERRFGFGQIVLFTHDRASDATLDLLASKVISEL